MINLKNKSECCGCNACSDICSKNAISFQQDIEGFLYPVVDKNLCTDCNACNKVCPILNSNNLKTNEFKKPECHASISKNIMTRFDSTSGGIFSVLANQMYRNGGYVGGAIFDEGWMVSQFISNNKEDLKKIRGSKLHQSDARGFYLKVRTLLRKGEKVLVCGTPCQMAALRSFLRKQYDNLIIVDFICLGINSPLVFKKWLSYLENEYGAKVTKFRIKNKELGWRNLTSKIEFENGKVLYDTKDTNFFTNGYIQSKLFCRPSCYDCKFKGFPRISDITVGDFWGGDRAIPSDLDGNLGTSIVLLNNSKGKSYFESVKSKIKEIPVDLNVVEKGNPALNFSIKSPLAQDRTLFYKELNDIPFKQVANKYIKRKIDKVPSFKEQLINTAKYFIRMKNAYKFNVVAYFKNTYLNLFDKSIKTNIRYGQYLIVTPYTILDVDKSSIIDVKGCVTLGLKKVENSKLETRIQVSKNSKIEFKGDATIYYGADIEVFENSCLSIGRNFVSNINFTCICADKISFGDDVSFGRNCTVRDNNGGHFISRRGYKNSHPISIAQHCWICEESIIMPGSKLSTGVIVSARSYVQSSIPAFCMVKGNPAEVVDEEVYFKM